MKRLATLLLALLAVVSLGPEPMIRRLGLIYRKDKALSKAALGFIQVILDHAGSDRMALPPRLPRVAAT